MLRRTVFAAAAVAALVATATTTPSGAAVGNDTAEYREAVTADGANEHMEAFQAIADANDGHRAAGTSGYDASVDYVVDRLEAAGYDPVVQEFPFAFFQELAPSEFERISPDPAVFVEPDDFAIMSYSGSGEVTGALVPTNDVIIPPPAAANGSTSGCEASDFAPASATEPQVALIQRGTCTFELKAANAQAAGYDAVVIFNEGQEGRTDAVAGTLGRPFTLPVLGASFAVGEELYGQTQSTVTVRIETSTLSEERTASNVLADTARGRADRTVVVGAHLDSVLAGPGVNDNGSGSGMILELAEEMGELGIEPTNRVRFAWWGAEENGLLGSEHYVANLTAGDRRDIALNLNFDMVASPNFVRFVYDGDGDATGTRGPGASHKIEGVFLDHFAAEGLPVEATAFDGRSDYGPFIAAGIPAGGLFTGAEGIKTDEQVAVYGGVAGDQYDPCYHAVCDTWPDNVDLGVLEEMSDAAAHATLIYAMTSSAVGGAGQSSDQATANAATGEFDGGARIR